MTSSGLLGPLVGAIETARRQMLTRRGDLTANETRTRNSLINPILRALDWNVSDSSQVTTEYDLPSGRVDYALLESNGKVIVVIEAKKLGEDIAKHRGQLVRYAYESQPTFAVLTDGDIWELYSIEATDSDFQFIRRAIISLSENEPIQSAWALLSLWQLNLAGEQPAGEPTGEPSLNNLKPEPPSESRSVEQEQSSTEDTEAGRKERQREAAETRRRRSEMSQVERDELDKALFADWQSGMTYRAIAKKHGMHPNGSNVWQIVDRMKKRQE